MIRNKTTAYFRSSVLLYPCAGKFSYHLEPKLTNKFHLTHIEKKLYKECSKYRCRIGF